MHLTLIGMNNEGYRRNGGAGFCIFAPSARIEVSLADRFSVCDSRKAPLEAGEEHRLLAVASQFAKRPVCIDISGDMPSHYGFGSATGIRLAALEAMAVLDGGEPTPGELVRLSGRGGTSGVGVTTYFEGGLVVDLGAKAKLSKLLPSSSLEHLSTPPLVLSRIPLPRWNVGVCAPGTVAPLSGDEEIAFFRKTCPIPQPAVDETLYHVIYGLLAGGLERDLATFSEAVRRIQSCRWKAAERKIYGKKLMSIETAIYRAGASAVGLSSVGPSLFFLGKNVKQMVAALRLQMPENSWYCSRICNAGRSLTRGD